MYIWSFYSKLGWKFNFLGSCLYITTDLRNLILHKPINAEKVLVYLNLISSFLEANVASS